MSVSVELAGYATIPEPELLFAENKKHKHPLLGLIAHGPYGLRLSPTGILEPLRDRHKGAS